MFLLKFMARVVLLLVNGIAKLSLHIGCYVAGYLLPVMGIMLIAAIFMKLSPLVIIWSVGMVLVVAVLLGVGYLEMISEQMREKMK